MKHLLACILAMLFVKSAESQAVQKGDFEILAGTGFGVYGVTSNDFEDNSSAGVPGLLSLAISYQVSEPWSLGLRYERMGFITEKDSNNKAVSNNIGLTGGCNLVNNDKHVIHLSAEIGSSSFRYDDFKEEAYVIGKGAYFQLGAGWKRYWNERLGMYLSLSVPYFHYSNFKNDDEEKLTVTKFDSQGFLIEERIFSVNMIGVNVRFGILFKI